MRSVVSWLPVLVVLAACTEPASPEVPPAPATAAPEASVSAPDAEPSREGSDADPADDAAAHAAAVADAADTGGAADSDSGEAVAPGPAVVADWTIGVPSRTRDEMLPALLQALRFGRHEGYDRMVLQFQDALPGWHVEYIDHPVRACGSGNVVDLPGDAHLLVRTVPAVGHTEAGEATVARRYEPDLVNVIAVARTCDFEGEVSYVLGVHSPTPFRLLELEDPPRLVVDVRLPKRLLGGN